MQRIDSTRIGAQVSEAINYAVAGAEGWELVGDIINEALPGAATGFVRYRDDANGVHVDSFARHFRPSFVVSYEEHFAAVNPWMADMQRMPSGTVFIAERVRPYTTFRGTEFCEDWLLAHGDIEAGATAKLVGQEDDFLNMTIHYPVRFSEHYDQAIAEIFTHVRPDLEQALETGHRLLDAWTEGSTSTSLLAAEVARSAGLVLNTFREVQSTTPSADRLLNSRSGIEIRRGSLSFASPALDAWLRSCIAALRVTREVISFSKTGEVAGAASRLEIWKLPKPPTLVPSLIPDRFALTIRRLDRLDLQDGAAQLADYYDLTAAEVRIVSLLGKDLSVVEISEELSLSVHTVRTHLKSAMSKTGSRRQSELVGKVFRFSH